jgi:hypothetical protein
VGNANAAEDTCQPEIDMVAWDLSLIPIGDGGFKNWKDKTQLEGKLYGADGKADADKFAGALSVLWDMYGKVETLANLNDTSDGTSTRGQGKPKKPKLAEAAAYQLLYGGDHTAGGWLGDGGIDDIIHCVEYEIAESS